MFASVRPLTEVAIFNFSALTGTVTLNGNLGNATPLRTLTTNATTVFNGTSVITTGDQIYNSPLALVGNVTLTTTNNGNVTFNNSINANSAADRNLTITTNGTGDVLFTQAVGASFPLRNLTITTDMLTSLATAPINLKPIAASNYTIRTTAPTSVLAGALSGGGSFTKGTNTVGTATEKASLLTLSGANTFSGNVTVYHGGLRLTNSNSLGAGTKTINVKRCCQRQLPLDLRCHQRQHQFPHQFLLHHEQFQRSRHDCQSSGQ